MTAANLISLIFLVEFFLCGFWFTGTAFIQAFLVVTAFIGCRAVLARGGMLVHSLSGLMLVYLVWIFVVAYKSEVPYTAMMTLASIASLPVVYLVVTNTPAFASIWKYLRLSFFAIGVVFGLWALWQAAHNTWYGDVVGPLHDSNLFAATINALWFPVAFLFLISQSHRWKLIFLGSGLFIMSAALFATASRGGIGTWILLLPLLLWAGYRNQSARGMLVSLVLIALAAYLFSVYVLHANVFERNLALSNDESFSARLLLWQSSLKMMLVHPIIGFGWGTFINYYPAYRSLLEGSSAGYFAHNDYLQFATEGGIFAMVLLAGLLMAVLIHLKRSMKRADEDIGLESVTLLLGLLALFIHAGVNFIFYFAFINVLAGLYLGRVANLTEVSRTVALVDVHKISVPLRHVLAGSIFLIMLVPVVPNLAAEFLNQKSYIKFANLEGTHINPYKIAKFVTQLKPEAFVAQEIVLRTAEQGLADKQFLTRLGVVKQRALLQETLQRFEVVRALNANNPMLGVRQAQLLITHHVILDAEEMNQGAAYARAHQVLNDNLKVNPYHVESIIMLSRLQKLQGQHADALSTLRHAEPYIYGFMNKQFISLEILRYLSPPAVIPELDEMEKDLQLMSSDAEIYRLSVQESRYAERLSLRLNELRSNQN